MEPIHVQLSDKTIDVPMSEVFGENDFLKLVNVFDGKLLPISHPLNDLGVFIVLGKVTGTLII